MRDTINGSEIAKLISIPRISVHQELSSFSDGRLGSVYECLKQERGINDCWFRKRRESEKWENNKCPPHRSYEKTSKGYRVPVDFSERSKASLRWQFPRQATGCALKNKHGRILYFTQFRFFRPCLRELSGHSESSNIYWSNRWLCQLDSVLKVQERNENLTAPISPSCSWRGKMGLNDETP